MCWFTDRMAVLKGGDTIIVNFTNHASANWPQTQTEAASIYGSIKDLPFPEVDPNGDEEYLAKLAEAYAGEILSHAPSAVLCQGEMTLSFAVTNILLEKGVKVLAACSGRDVTESINEGGVATKKVGFRFVRFREYVQPLKYKGVVYEN